MEYRRLSINFLSLNGVGLEGSSKAQNAVRAKLRKTSVLEQKDLGRGSPARREAARGQTLGSLKHQEQGGAHFVWQGLERERDRPRILCGFLWQ